MSYKLYSPQNFATAGAKVELFSRFIDIPIQFVRIPWDQWKSAQYLAKHPLGKVPTLQTPEGCIYQSCAILRYLARKAGKFYGNTPAQTASIDQWLEFLNTQLNANNIRTIYGTLGYREVTKEQYQAGKKDYQQVLKTVEAQLKKTPYLVGDSITIADIALIGGIRLALRLFLDQTARSAIPSVVQWYERLFTHKQVSGFFGKPWLCTKEILPEFATEKKQEKKEEKKEEKKAEKKAEKAEKKPAAKKEQPKKQQKKDKKKKKQSEQQEDQPLVPVQKKKNALQLLPKSPFNIDDWKREFCNSPDKKQTLNELWTKFDHEGWSLWKVAYIKYQGQGKVGYLTNNLKNGHLRNIDHFRKYTFATYGVYGEQGNYEIDGIWMWRGTQIPQQWKEHQSYQYFTFTRLDERDPAVQALTAEYWFGLTENDTVCGRKVYEAKWFK